MKTPKLPLQQPPQPAQIDLSLATDVTCDNCQNHTFTEVSLMKHVSALMSPTSKAGYVPIPTFACNSCGFVNTDFLPPYMRQAAKSESVTESTLTEPKPAPTKIEVVQ